MVGNGLRVYPETSLKDARQKRDEARKALAQGIDPGEQRKAMKAAQADADSFEVVAREWYAKFSPTWTPERRRASCGALKAEWRIPAEKMKMRDPT